MRARLIRALVLAAVLSTAALAISCSDGFPTEFQAPGFTLNAPLMEQSVSNVDLKGRPYIIYWFASW